MCRMPVQKDIAAVAEAISYQVDLDWSLRGCELEVPTDDRCYDDDDIHTKVNDENDDAPS